MFFAFDTFRRIQLFNLLHQNIFALSTQFIISAAVVAAVVAVVFASQICQIYFVSLSLIGLSSLWKKNSIVRNYILGYYAQREKHIYISSIQVSLAMYERYKTNILKLLGAYLGTSSVK